MKRSPRYENPSQGPCARLASAWVLLLSLCGCAGAGELPRQIVLQASQLAPGGNGERQLYDFLQEGMEGLALPPGVEVKYSSDPLAQADDTSLFADQADPTKLTYLMLLYYTSTRRPRDEQLYRMMQACQARYQAQRLQFVLVTHNKEVDYALDSLYKQDKESIMSGGCGQLLFFNRRDKRRPCLKRCALGADGTYTLASTDLPALVSDLLGKSVEEHPIDEPHVEQLTHGHKPWGSWVISLLALSLVGACAAGGLGYLPLDGQLPEGTASHPSEQEDPLEKEKV